MRTQNAHLLLCPKCRERWSFHTEGRNSCQFSLFCTSITMSLSYLLLTYLFVSWYLLLVTIMVFAIKLFIWWYHLTLAKTREAREAWRKVWRRLGCAPLDREGIRRIRCCAEFRSITEWYSVLIYKFNYQKIQLTLTITISAQITQYVIDLTRGPCWSGAHLSSSWKMRRSPIFTNTDRISPFNKVLINV